jgi:feruloyl esterase
MRSALVGLLVVLLAMAQPSPIAATACERLSSFVLPGGTITSAQRVEAGKFDRPGARGGTATFAVLPAFCRVTAVLAPSSDSHIEMEVWLPLDKWNGKFQAVGNGGWAGAVSYTVAGRSLADALRQGYATASTDTGHQGDGGLFAIGHAERVIDFAYRAVHEMTVKSKAIIAEFYGRPARLSYWNGCSTGGRQGLMEAQRYPEDFDALIVGAPVNNHIRLHAAQMTRQTEILRDVSKVLPPEKLALVGKAVLASCDANDGVKDGIVSDPGSCRFDPSSLKCTDSSTENCLTEAQVDTAKRAYSDVNTRSGEFVYPGSSPGFEAGWRMPQPGGQLPTVALDSFRYLGHQDANWNGMKFDLDTDLALVLQNAGFIDAINPDLATFKARGGKLLMYHGWADPGPAPANTINYYSAVQKKVGGRTDEWMRLFLLPGVGHCGGGIGPDSADYIAALERWREAGMAPDRLTASRTRNGQVVMTRPLCPYPQVAKWTGTGSTDDARSFTCSAR